MPEPPVEIAAPDITAYRQGNTGVPYVTAYESGRAGPHAVITALVHGNELCGALALVELFERDIRPKRGRLSLAFVNTAAFERFDPEHPKASRYVDEDLNRVWDPAILDGPRDSVELARAREIRPLIESADALLDLHSMQLPAPPLLLCGLAAKGRRLAQAIGYPGLVVADAGHRGGPRMRDFGAFANPDGPPAAMLVECGQHWAASSVGVAIATCGRFLAALDLIAPEALDQFATVAEPGPQRLIEVTHAVTVNGGPFRFTEDFQGLEVVPRRGTVIGHDGAQPVRTPYDDCVLIMPSRRLGPGLTAVRLGRFVD
jgi:Succinylglutamate desuccinylase / Aspartoacylase family